MKNTMNKLNELQKAKDQFQAVKDQIAKGWAEAAKVETSITSVIDDTFISYKAKNESDIKNILSNLEPYKTSHELGSNKIIVSSPYRIENVNNYRSTEFRISFEMINNIKVWITIDTKNLSDTFKDAFLISGSRGLYSTETIYVNIPAHFKKFKNIRVPAMYFKNSETITFFGGNVSLKSTEEIKNIINTLNK